MFPHQLQAIRINIQQTIQNCPNKMFNIGFYKKIIKEIFLPL